MPDWYKIQKIYVGTNQVRPKAWKPWSETIAYYPLTSETTVNDMSGNNRNLTNKWGTFGTYEWVSCVYVGGSSRYLYINDSWMPTWNSARTFAFWHYNLNSSPTRNAEPFIVQWTLSTNKILMLYTWDSGSSSTNSYYNQITQYWTWATFWTSPRGEWVCNVVTYDWAKFTWYVNWTSTGTWTYTIATNGTRLSIWCAVQWTSVWNAFNWYMSKVVLSSGVRTAQEISDYYNSTKSDYWL